MYLGTYADLSTVENLRRKSIGATLGVQEFVLVITALIHPGLGTHLIAGEVLAGASVHFILLLLLLDGPGCAAPVVITCRLAILVDVIKDQVPHLLQLVSGDIHRFVHNAPAQKGCAGRLRQAALIAYICFVLLLLLCIPVWERR